MKISQEDKTRLNVLGIPMETVLKQYEQLKAGPEPLDLIRPCTIGDGIIKFNQKELDDLVSNYEIEISGKKILVFTPASGAATRMFKHLYDPENEQELVSEFLENLSKFAFFDKVSSLLSEKEMDNSLAIINKVLSEDGLNYGNLPKAMIDFHKYDSETHKAIDDQLIEGIKYVMDQNVSRFHFTISPEHETLVKNHLETIYDYLSNLGKSEIDVTFSTQSSSTDTVALDSQDELVHDADGNLVLRPGGHGALIHNLNELEADIVFIKNIDNIVRVEFQDVVVKNKKVLGSILLKLQREVFTILSELKSASLSESRLNAIVQFISNEFSISVKQNPKDIFDALNKPIRVCGMVKNEGKAGGGPFWVGNSVQIVETAQMNLEDNNVQDILNSATHFNPVDMVCGLRDYTGKKFNLLNYINEKTFFVSSKSIEGEDIKVIEYPGLWNGAMADWLTVFVEVPIETFHPVKTVNDLLQPAHQPKR